MAAKDGAGGMFGDISTRAELKQRLANRAKPQAARHLTIGGHTEADVKRRLGALTEKRIIHLQNRLDAARSGVRRDQAKARLKGKARGEFDRIY